VHCRSCEEENSETAKFCQACGTALAEHDDPVEASPAETAPQPQPAANASPAAPAPAPEPVVTPAAPVQSSAPNAHPKFAPITVEQAEALLQSEKRYPWVSVPAGAVSFVALLAGLAAVDSRSSYFLPLSILGAAVIYLGTHFLLLPAMWPAKIHCPQCGKFVPISRHALPKSRWPWACPHCNQELAPKPA